MLGRREEASTSSIGLAIAAVTFAGAFVVAQLMVAQPAARDHRPQQFDLAAETALDLLVRDAGVTGSGLAWADSPDDLLRFGLAREGEPNFLDYLKIKALRNGTFSASMNDAPDYPEVRAALGITTGDFHLRSYPVLPTVDDPRWAKEPNGRLAYFAHYSGATAPAYLDANTSLTSDRLNVSVQIRNDALVPAVYVAAFSLGNQTTEKKYVTEERHTRLLMPGESQEVWVRYSRLDDWRDDIDAVHLLVTDPYNNIAVDTSGTKVGSFWVPATPPEGGSDKHNLLVAAAKVYYQSGDKVTFHADHYNKDGDHLNSQPSARFVMRGPEGREWVNQSITLPKQPNQVWTYECPNCTAVGNYTAIVYDTWERRQMDVVHVAAQQMFTEKGSIDPVAINELGILGGLVVNFNPTRYDAETNPEGDVFGDDSNGPSEMVDVLSRYSWLVIGSEVTQTALNAASTKYGIADWVQAGGNLVVLGTHTQQSRWLEPVYHAAQITANGGISAPDPTHPVLTSPNRLSYERYLDRARAWDIDNDAPFTHVLARAGGGGNSKQDTLALSHPGAYNDGTVVLTSYMPGSLTEPQDPGEAKRLLHNLLSQSHTMLFLDFGPPIPEGVPVGSAQRLVAVPHPNVPGAVVEVRLVMYVFG